jgi:DNA helicase HerA-like ATPase
MELSEPT